MLDPTTPFRNANDILDFSILDFWKWSHSQLLENNLRGVLAEYIVMMALGIKNEGRKEWVAYDLETEDGIRIEVKSSAYLQNWEQTRHSKISFGIGAASAWDYDVDKRSKEIKRQSDIYIFCVFKETDRTRANPMNLHQWDFYLLPTRVLDEKCAGQKTIGLGGVQKLGAVKCQFEELEQRFIEIMKK